MAQVTTEQVREKLLMLYPDGASATTDTLVRRLQKDRGLVVDGIVGPKTLAALSLQGTPPASGSKSTKTAASSGGGVSTSQIRTKLMGLYPDATASTTTDALVRRFQKDSGLQVDGKVGPKTIAALGFTNVSSGSAKPASATEVADRLTPLTAEQAAAALSMAYESLIGVRPTPEILSLLLGQSALETGNWKKIHNYNFGNKKAAAGDKLIQRFLGSEIVNGEEVFSVMAFTAYPTALEGAKAYITLLKSRPLWWAGLQSGNPETFTQNLAAKPLAYFTASPRLYLEGLTERAQAFADLASKYGGAAAGIGLGTIALGIGAFFFGRKLVGRK